MSLPLTSAWGTTLLICYIMSHNYCKWLRGFIMLSPTCSVPCHCQSEWTKFVAVCTKIKHILSRECVSEWFVSQAAMSLNPSCCVCNKSKIFQMFQLQDIQLFRFIKYIAIYLKHTIKYIISLCITLYISFIPHINNIILRKHWNCA